MNLGPNTLAKSVAKLQEENGYPGLISECKSLLEEFNMLDANPNETTKMKWKNLVKAKVHKMLKQNYFKE